VVREGLRDARREGGVVVYVAGVGGGKTVAFALPAYAQPDGMTVVIQPLMSLPHNTAQMLLGWHIKAAVWEEVAPTGEYSVVLVSPEGMNSKAWDLLINLQKSDFRVNRVVLDEAQEVLVSKEFCPPLETRSTVSPVILERPILT
jgi:superfamily II DNA helicase RecQ